MMTTQQQKLVEIIRPAVEALGCILWGVEYLPQGKHSILRVYIDHEDGVTLEHCEVVSKQISSVLDVEDPIQSNYVLEVSSPGMDRPLFNVDQCQMYCGETVRVRLQSPIKDRRKWTGTLTAVEGDILNITAEGQALEIDWHNIDKINVVPSFSQ